MSRGPTLGAAGRGLLIAYELLGLAAFVVLASATVLGKLTGRPWFRRLGERLGRYGDRRCAAPNAAVVWMHAASIGEIRAAEPLLAALRARLPRARFVLTSQTATGRALASSLAVDEHRYFPLDCRFAVRRALAHFRPSLFVFVETEIWPRVLLELAAAGVPAAMVSARVSEPSYRRYRSLGSVFAPVLATLSCVCARDEDSRARLVDLGAPAERSVVTGDLKLDALDAASVAATPDALSGADRDVHRLFAVSTHEGEELIVLNAFARVRCEHPSTQLILAPRHPRRAIEVAALAAKYGRTAVWSRERQARGWEILVLDTTGEARGFFRSAECGFVGGSLVGVGGHNLAEPASFGVPCAVGPHLDNVRHQAELLRGADALVVIEDAEGLARIWSRWLRDPVDARRIGDAARAAVEAGRGAIGRTLVALEPLVAGARAGAAE